MTKPKQSVNVPDDPEAYLFPLDPEFASHLTAPLIKAMAENQERFLQAYAVTGTDRAACQLVSIARRTVNDWKHDDKLGFLARYELAKASFGAFLEGIALDRVMNPQERGRLGSDVLLIALLNANLPDKYRREAQSVDDAALKVMALLRAPLSPTSGGEDQRSPAGGEPQDSDGSVKRLLDSVGRD